MDSNIFANYTDVLIARIYKILPLYEEENEGFYTYISSLIFELNGIYWSVLDIRDNSEYLTLISVLEAIGDKSLEKNHATVKREVFKCIDVIKKLRNVSLQ